MHPLQHAPVRLAHLLACKSCLLSHCPITTCSPRGPSLQGSLQVAEGERDTALAKLACYTPRPAAPLGGLTALLGPTLSLRLAEAVAAHRYACMCMRMCMVGCGEH